MTLIDPASQILLLVRFLCFMAVVYLGLHKLVLRLSTKPGSKLLWFFSVLTAPLTSPIRRWIAPKSSDDQVITSALFFYGVLWLVIVLLERSLTDG